MNYYRIDPCLFGEYWAWGESITENPVFSEETAARCPLCGRMVQGRNWKGPYDIRLNKKSKIGDFIYGTPFNVLASQRFVDLFTMAGLKGIRVEQKVNLYYRKNLLTESYFLLEFEYSTKKVELAWELNKERKRDKTLPKCSLCKKNDDKHIRNYKEIYFTDAREFDIFRIYEQPGRLYCNQYFIDFCQQNNITNVVEWCKQINK